MKRINSIPKLRRRPRESHKGDFGTVLIIGGSRGMIGAPALAAQAALRSGAGLVVLACPASIQLPVAALCPCATSIPLPEESERIDPRATLDELRQRGFLGDRRPSVAAVGPGLARGDGRFDANLLEMLQGLLDAEVQLVLDADALNALHKSGGSVPGWDQIAWQRTVITPHPGEMARLQGVSTDEIQERREEWAVRTARQMSSRLQPEAGGPVVVLKGAGTLVTDGERLYRNKTGNPGMATGGSGDVLTGIIAGLIAQKMPVFDAAVCGAFHHGLAGDLAARKLGQVSIIASDLIDFLPDAFTRRK